MNYYSKDDDINNPRYYALKQACKYGVLPTVQSIIQSQNSLGSNLDHSGPIAQTLLQKCLFEAFSNSNFDVARYLIREAGAKIDSGMTWHASYCKMSIQAFEFLLQEGWDINAPVSGAMTALCYVLSSLPLTKWLLEHGANPNLGPHPHRMSPVPMIPNSGYALNVAAEADPAIAITIIDLLVQYGARLEDSLPLHWLAEAPPHQSLDDPTVSSVTSQFSEIGIDPSGTSVPSSSSRIPVLQHLLNLGYDPNTSDARMFAARAVGPPLHWALRSGRVENARFLLENGADPWGKDRHGRNALEAVKQERERDGEGELHRLLKEFM